MSRAARLLDLLQCLRRHRHPVSGQALARELGISLRTLYRDVATLQGQGAGIEGEAGLGYVLRPGFLLPPLMFEPDEIEALVLGSRWVAERGDARLSAAARNALARIAAVLPDDARAGLEDVPLLAGPGTEAPRAAVGDAELAAMRVAIRTERKVEIVYRDGGARETRRVIWPFAVGFFDQVRVVAAWCELREGFRHFRTDRIAGQVVTQTRYPKRRQVLARQWREAERIGAQ